MSASFPRNTLAIIPPMVEALKMRLISGSLAFNPSGSFMKRRNIWLIEAAPKTIIIRDIKNHL